jgi:hypothetical protein
MLVFDVLTSMIIELKKMLKNMFIIRFVVVFVSYKLYSIFNICFGEFDHFVNYDKKIEIEVGNLSCI